MSKFVRVAAVTVALSAFAMAQGKSWKVEVSAPAHHDVSIPLRDMPAVPRTEHPNREHPVKPLPQQAAGGRDSALQSQPGLTQVVPAGSVTSFAGVGKGDYSFSPDAAPPDTNGAVGATQYVQWVNESFAVFNKAGTLLKGPIAGNQLWAGFGGGCETNNDGDPIVQYDKAADRWILTQFSVSSTPYLQCVAVSTTGDATGSYNRYSYSFGTDFPDYPKVGVWPDAYYITFNIFANGSSFKGSRVCAWNRAAMLAGTPAPTQQCVQLSTSFGGLLPADLDGKTAPPSGAPNYVMNFGTNSLNIWKFHVDWTNTANSSLTGPVNVPVAAFSSACGGGTCIPQGGSSEKLDSLADRLMYRLAYRNFGTRESLVVNHSVKASATKRSEVDGIRWYEIRPNGSGYTVAQQGTYSPDSNSRWMGSVAMDKVGNMAMGYSVSSASMNPSIRFTGRLLNDPAGSMQDETPILTGGGSQLRNLARWGDYSSISVDPVDDCTFWFTTEYLKANGTFNWSTEISHFKFAGCQ